MHNLCMNKEPKQIRSSVSTFFNSKMGTDTIGILWEGYLGKKKTCWHFIRSICLRVAPETGHFSKLYKAMRLTVCKRLSLLGNHQKPHPFSHFPSLKAGVKREREFFL